MLTATQYLRHTCGHCRSISAAVPPVFFMYRNIVEELNEVYIYVYLLHNAPIIFLKIISYIIYNSDLKSSFVVEHRYEYKGSDTVPLIDFKKNVVKIAFQVLRTMIKIVFKLLPVFFLSANSSQTNNSQHSQSQNSRLKFHEIESNSSMQ